MLMIRYMKYTIGLTLVCLMAWDTAHASYKVSSPENIDPGAYDLEVRGTTGFDDDTGRDGAQSDRARLYYGLTDNWMLAAGASGGKSNAGDAWHADTWDIGARYEFWEPGSKSFEASLQFNVFIPVDDDGAYSWRPRLHLKKAFDMGEHKLTTVANLAFVREFGPHAGNDTEYRLGLKAAYDFGHPVVPFVEWHSIIDSTTNGWSDQRHVAGPFVEIPLTKQVSTTIGYLRGFSDAVSDHNVSWRLSLAF